MRYVYSAALALRRLATPLLAIGMALGTHPADALPLKGVGHRGTIVTVVASGLSDPRGLAFNPVGRAVVAEAGDSQGLYIDSPVDQGTQARDQCFINWPLGPVAPAYAASVARIGGGGTTKTLAANLPATSYNNFVGGDREGVSGVGFIGGTLYVLNPGGGCSHGHPRDPDALLRVLPGGATQVVADLGKFLSSQVDSKNPTDTDFEADGVWYSMVPIGNSIYTVEPNHGVLVKVNETGLITKLADLWAEVAAIDANGDGDKTYTAITARKDSLYVGTLGGFGNDFAGYIYRVSLDGKSVTQIASGLHGVVGLAFDSLNQIYALQTTAAGAGLSTPGSGSLVRVEADGSLTTLVSGLSFPAGLAAGPDGAFYVTNCGYHCDDHANYPPSLPSLHEGQVLRVRIPGITAAR